MSSMIRDPRLGELEALLEKNRIQDESTFERYVKYVEDNGKKPFSEYHAPSVPKKIEQVTQNLTLKQRPKKSADCFYNKIIPSRQDLIIGTRHSANGLSAVFENNMLENSKRNIKSFIHQADKQLAKLDYFMYRMFSNGGLQFR